MNDLPYDVLDPEKKQDLGIPFLDGLDQLAYRALSFLQQYGVLALVVVLLLMIVFRYTFKTQQNTRFQQMFSIRAISIFLLIVMFVFLPYIVFNMLESDQVSEPENLPTNDEVGSYVIKAIPFFQTYVYVLTINVTIAMLVWRFIYGIRKNDRLRQTYLVRAAGMVTVCILSFVIPIWIIKHLG